MFATLTHKLDIPNVQKAVALRDRTTAWLEDQGITVLSAQMQNDLPHFIVVGVDVQNAKPFKDEVEADDEAAAKAKCESKTRVVAEVRRV